jgi:hypothetical protein
MTLASEFEYLIHFSKELSKLSAQGIITINESGIFDIRNKICKPININELHHMVTNVDRVDL